MEPAALTPREILGLLAEEDRLRVVSALVLGATTSAEVAAATGMTVRETGRALARLAAGGLVESGTDGYRLRAEALREMAMADARPEPGPPGPDDENASVLGRFIRGDRLTSIPAARRRDRPCHQPLGQALLARRRVLRRGRGRRGPRVGDRRSRAVTPSAGGSGRGGRGRAGPRPPVSTGGRGTSLADDRPRRRRRRRPGRARPGPRARRSARGRPLRASGGPRWRRARPAWAWTLAALHRRVPASGSATRSGSRRSVGVGGSAPSPRPSTPTTTPMRGRSAARHRPAAGARPG